jgi:glycosyltransferase involved in cell wall biosynthesis
MKSPLICVVVPCYNQAEFLSECLGSVLSQTFGDWEAIVVDDGSIDEKIPEVLKSFADSRIKLICHEQNKGLAAARNTGFRLSKAPLVLPLDCDDMLKPQYLHRVGGELMRRGEANCAFADFEHFGIMQTIGRFELGDVEMLLRRQWLPGAGTLMRRSLWEGVGGYCEAPELRYGNEDWDFWLGAAEHGLGAIHLPEPFYCYRKHVSSMVDKLQKYDYITREYIYRRHRRLFDSYGAGMRFLADGYKQSACALWNEKKRVPALKLALHGLTLDRGWQDMSRAARAMTRHLR